MISMNKSHGYTWISCGLVLFALFATACSGGSSTAASDPAAARNSVDPTGYAEFIDANGNGVNDYVEAGYHDPGSGAPYHAFIDVNGDGICDYAQNGTQSWHGPRYVDVNRDGICDRWQQGGGSRPRCW